VTDEQPVGAGHPQGDGHPVGVVCFDWGGVILRICRSFPEGVKAAGLDQREGVDNAALFDVRRAFSAKHQVGEISDDEFFARVSESYNGLYTPDEVALVHDAWLLGEYDGVSGLVGELHETAPCPTALLSNTNARHWGRRVSDFPTAGLLHLQHASHLLGLAKPNEQIYEAFENETGFSGAQIVFFDDLEPNILAARNRGWRAVQVDHTGDPASQMRRSLVGLGVLS
jgi:FMN phosphatase YigB (HAD superfamily)